MSATTTSDAPANTFKHALRVRRPKGAAHKHPVNQLHHDEATFGERLADRISAGIGSWPFLIVESIAGVILLGGHPLLFFPFDPQPLLLLDLLFFLSARYPRPG